LIKFGREVSSGDIADMVNQRKDKTEKLGKSRYYDEYFTYYQSNSVKTVVSQVILPFQDSFPILILADDTLYIMAGLGLLDMVAEDSYKANHVTKHLVEHPTKIQGILHL
jgi:hypothetical protein